MGQGNPDVEPDYAAKHATYTDTPHLGRARDRLAVAWLGVFDIADLGGRVRCVEADQAGQTIAQVGWPGAG